MTTVNNRPNGVDSMLTSATAAANSKSVASAQDQLEKLFVQQGTVNEGSDGAKKIEAQIQTLEAKIAKLEDEAQKILAEIEEKEATLNKKTQSLADSAAKLTGAQAEYQGIIKGAAESAARSAVKDYDPSKGSSFKNFFNQEFEKSLAKMGANRYNGMLQNLYQNYLQNQGQVTPIAAEIEDAIGDVRGLQNQVKNINATKTLLTRTATLMKDSQVADAYKNCDTDSNVPMFSGQKAEFANSLLAQYTSRNNKEAAKGVDLNASKGSAAKIQEAKDKWSGYNTATYKSGDIYSAQSNPELMNLRKAFEGGMLDDLQGAGMSANDILTFVSTNWKVGISQGKDGTWNIPNGHSSDAWCKEGVFGALSNIAKNGAAANVTADSVNSVQMEEMKTAVLGKSGDGSDGILTQMYEHGFSYKEAMYTLTKLFPDAGVSYDPTKSGRSYEMVADNDKSGKLYETIGNQVKNYWDVGSTAKKTAPSDPVPSKRTDPVTWQDGDTTYTFVVDRDGDGKFDYNSAEDNDLMGSKGGMEELLAYDDNGDGVLSAEEMKNHGIMIMANKQSESYNDKASVDKNINGKNYTNSVDFNISYHNAEDLGITSLDLNGAARGSGSGEAVGSSTKNYDGTQEAYDDINGSSVINTFTINKKDGSTINAKETLNTEQNLDTFYGKVAKASNQAGSMSIKLTEGEVADAFNNADGSAAIDGVLDRLEELKKAHSNDVVNEDPIVDGLNYDTINEMTGRGHLDKMRDRAEQAAERKMNDEEGAVDAAGNEIDKYFAEFKPVNKEKEDDKNNK